MITTNEIISDLKSVMAKVEYMAITFKNNDIWKQIDKELDSVLTTLQKDRKMYGY
jgi:hypothetical protein